MLQRQRADVRISHGFRHEKHVPSFPSPSAIAAGMLIGYARVSTEDQRLDLQRNALATLGWQKVFEDRASGARADRPGLAAALSHLRRGDTLVVWRLSRTTHQLVNLLERFEHEGIKLRSLQDGIDPSSVMGRRCCKSVRCSPRWNATYCAIALMPVWPPRGSVDAHR